jgi:hypothetical protein
VATSTLITERAAQQAGQLRKKERRSYDQFLLTLRAHGCASLNCRLSGDGLLSKICVAHISGSHITATMDQGVNGQERATPAGVHG